KGFRYVIVEQVSEQFFLQIVRIGGIFTDNIVKILNVVVINGIGLFDRFPVDVDVCVFHNTEQPCADVRSFFILIPETECLQECFLEKVPRIVCVAGHPERIIIENVRMRYRFSLELFMEASWRIENGEKDWKHAIVPSRQYRPRMIISGEFRILRISHAVKLTFLVDKT